MPTESQLSVPYAAARTLANISNAQRIGRTIPADAAASTTTAETLIGRVPHGCTVTSIKLTGGAALTASDTVYATITVYARDTNGANQVTVATIVTKITAGTGNWTAFKPVTWTTVANGALLADWVLSYAVAKASTGTQLPETQLDVVVSSNP
jgi:hypothetical protein